MLRFERICHLLNHVVIVAVVFFILAAYLLAR